MTTENPTADGDVSIRDRLERYLSQDDAKPEVKQEVKEEVNEEVEVSADAEETPVEVEEPAGDDKAEETEPQVELSDVARFLGVDETALDVSDDGAILVKTKIDGKEGTAKFNDLVKSYQLQGHVDAKAREAAEKAKALEERVKQFETYAQSKAQEFTQLAQVAQQELLQEYQAVDWENLSQSDPTEYVRKQHQFQTRHARVNQLLAVAENQRQQADRAQKARVEQMIQAEASKLPVLIPEWSDEKVAEAEKSELKTWLKSQGFTDDDIGQLYSASAVAAYRKAMLFDKMKSKTEVIEKKIRVAPKIVKPGTSVKVSAQEAKAKELKQKIRQSGGKEGIAELLMATGRV